jgi:hypothetical protein
MYRPVTLAETRIQNLLSFGKTYDTQSSLNMSIYVKRPAGLVNKNCV